MTTRGKAKGNGNGNGGARRSGTDEVRRGEAGGNGGEEMGDLQRYGTLKPRAIGLGDEVRRKSALALNQILADTMMLRDLYKKAHWQATGPTFYQLHELFDDHYKAQVELTDLLAERVQILGGVSLAVPADVAEETQIERPPRHIEEPADVLLRLLSAHEIILTSARRAAQEIDAQDLGTQDLLGSEIVPRNEMQVWFLSEHLEPAGLVEIGELVSEHEEGEERPEAP